MRMPQSIPKNIPMPHAASHDEHERSAGTFGLLSLCQNCIGRHAARQRLTLGVIEWVTVVATNMLLWVLVADAIRHMLCQRRVVELVGAAFLFEKYITRN